MYITYNVERSIRLYNLTNNLLNVFGIKYKSGENTMQFQAKKKEF